MINDGLGTDIHFDEIHWLLRMPGHPIVEFELRHGHFMGVREVFKIVVRGAGGCASRPHECNDAPLSMFNCQRIA